MTKAKQNLTDLNTTVPRRQDHQKKQQADSSKQQHVTDLFKRNKAAPDLNGTLVRNRAQFIIEKYIQNFDVPLSEYIKKHQYLVLEIPTTILQEWYPGPNWKKDLRILCSDMMSKRVEVQHSNGNFTQYNLISFCELNDDALVWHIHPDALSFYCVGNQPSSNLDYNVSQYFRLKYSHQIYWECEKHTNPFYENKFFVTPANINEIFQTNYSSSNIQRKILGPVEQEFRNLYESGRLRFFIRYETKRKIEGKSRSTEGWTIFIIQKLNEEDENKKIWIQEIEEIIRKYLPSKRCIIIPQIENLNKESLSKIYYRFCQLRNGELETKNNPANFICHILINDFKINPNVLAQADQEPVSTLLQRNHNVINKNQSKWDKFMDLSKELLYSHKYITGKLTLNSWDVWIKPLNFISFECNTVKVLASPYCINYIEENLIKDIEPALREAFGEDVQLIYVSDERQI